MMLRSNRRKRRGAADTASERWSHADTVRHDDPGTPLHEERLDAVVAILLESGAQTVLDLGCGSGTLISRLASEEQFTRIVGVDTSAEALLAADRRLAPFTSGDSDRVWLHHDSFAAADPRLMGFDAAAMVETIEHIEPEHLSLVERAVFAQLRPSMVVMTTPNYEYNVLYGIAEGEYRHSDHRFEWSRSRFRSWAAGVSERNAYEVVFEEVGPPHPLLGAPTQVAVFRRHQDQRI